MKSLCLAAAAIAAFLGTPTSAGIAGYFKDGNDILRACTAAMLRSAGFVIESNPEEEVLVCRLGEGDGHPPVYPARPRRPGNGVPA